MKDVFLLKTTGVATATADNSGKLQSQVDGLVVVVKETGEGVRVTCGEPVVPILAIGINDSNVRVVTLGAFAFVFRGEEMKFDDVCLVSPPEKEVALTQVESEVSLEMLDKNFKFARTSCAGDKNVTCSGLQFCLLGLLGRKHILEEWMFTMRSGFLTGGRAVMLPPNLESVTWDPEELKMMRDLEKGGSSAGIRSDKQGLEVEEELRGDLDYGRVASSMPQS